MSEGLKRLGLVKPVITVKEWPKIESILIGFGHRARTGKDTAIAHIVANRPDAKRYAFADILKQEVTQAALSSGGMQFLFDPMMSFYRRDGEFVSLPPWVVYEENPDMSDPMCPLGKQRTLLQWWGTDFRRIVEPDYWVDRLAEKLVQEKPKVALISDMRFPNEKEFIEKFGYSIKVHRPDVPMMDHPSEYALASVPSWDWNAVLNNDKSLEEFKAVALRVYDLLLDETF